MTRLIIENRHEKIGHNSGVEHRLTETRSRFWIIKGRRAVRTVVETTVLNVGDQKQSQRDK